MSDLTHWDEHYKMGPTPAEVYTDFDADSSARMALIQDIGCTEAD